MIVAIVPRLKQRAGLSHQILPMRDGIRRGIEGVFAIGGDVNVVLRSASVAQIDGAIVHAGGDRRIDQSG